MRQVEMVIRCETAMPIPRMRAANTIALQYVAEVIGYAILTEPPRITVVPAGRREWHISPKPKRTKSKRRK